MKTASASWTPSAGTEAAAPKRTMQSSVERKDRISQVAGILILAETTELKLLIMRADGLIISKGIDLPSAVERG
jgi:hypothetical protein